MSWEISNWHLKYIHGENSENRAYISEIWVFFAHHFCAGYNFCSMKNHGKPRTTFLKSIKQGTKVSIGPWAENTRSPWYNRNKMEVIARKMEPKKEALRKRQPRFCWLNIRGCVFHCPKEPIPLLFYGRPSTILSKTPPLDSSRSPSYTLSKSGPRGSGRFPTISPFCHFFPITSHLFATFCHLFAAFLPGKKGGGLH